MFANFQLTPMMQENYVTVRAHSVSTETAEATSNGIITGYIHSILPGMVTVTSYQSETTTLTIHWTDFQSNVPIVLYEWALGERNLTASDQRILCEDITDDYSSYFEASGFGLVDLDTTIEVEDLSLQHGMSYFVTVRVHCYVLP